MKAQLKIDSVSIPVSFFARDISPRVNIDSMKCIPRLLPLSNIFNINNFNIGSKKYTPSFYLSQTFSFIAAKAILDFILVTESGKTVLVMRKAYWSDVAWAFELAPSKVEGSTKKDW